MFSAKWGVTGDTKKKCAVVDAAGNVVATFYTMVEAQAAAKAMNEASA
jgi:hypothetical protein